MTGWNPPEGDKVIVDALKPLAPQTLYLLLLAFIDKGKEIIETGPDRKVDNNSIIFIRTQGCSIAFLGLQTPDETSSAVSKSVNVVQTRYKTSHDRISERCQYTGN